MRLADWVIERLKQAGIDHAFTVCGGGSIFLNDALAKAKRMKYIACHHEQAAAMAAEAYARVREGYGLAIVTSGPGGTNAITGVAGAWTDHVPTITISGQVFSAQMMDKAPGVRTLGVQEINIIDLVRSITKYAVTIKRADSIRYHLEYALWIAMNDRPGPVWLDIPADIQNAQIEPEKLKGYDGVRSVRAPRPADVQEVIDLLKDAKRPIVHIGQGVRIAGAQSALFKFLDRARIPVLTARNGADLIDSGHPLYIGRPGTFAQRGANFAVQTADVYLAIGTRLSLAQTGYNASDYARRATVVMVDVDLAELTKRTVNVELAIQADAKEFLTALNAALPETPPDWSGWLARCKAWQEKYPSVMDEQRGQAAEYVNSYALVEALSAAAGPDDVIVTDMGFAFQNTHQAWKMKQGQRLMTNCGLAAMGWGLPAAIGAAVGSGKRVIAIIGDGGMMMNVQELSTLAHHKLPVKIFLLNNGGYLTMRQSQDNAFDGHMGSDESSGLSMPKFQPLAWAHGLLYCEMRIRDTVKMCLDHSLSGNAPWLTEVRMDPNQTQIPKSINRRIDGKIVQTAIEDAWPFLPAEEVAENLRV